MTIQTKSLTLLFTSVFLLAGCGKHPGKNIEAVVNEYDTIASTFAPMFKAGTDKIEAGDMKGAVVDLESSMSEMAKVSNISIEGCPEDFIMAWATFVAKHDEARTAIGQFVASSKNAGSNDPLAGLAKMLLGGGLGAVMKLQQSAEELQAESSKLKVVCSKYGVDGSAFDVITRIESTTETH